MDNRDINKDIGGQKMSKDKTVKLKLTDCSYPHINIETEVIDDMSCPKINLSFTVQDYKQIIKQLNVSRKIRAWECDVEIIFKQRDHANAKKRKKK